MIDYSSVMTVEFDAENQIIDFSSTVSLKIDTPSEFKAFVAYLVKKTHELVGDDRSFMIFDFNTIIIDPVLTKEVTNSIREFYKKYLYPHGTAGYGKSFSRVTVKMSFREIKEQEEHLFGTRDEALEYIHQLIKEMKEINNAG